MAEGMLLVGTVVELEERGQIVVAGEDRPIVVFWNGGEPVAVDNRCPHMGFALSKGSCENGIITCPWHHARFEGTSGCTFDLFAGDVEPFTVRVEEGKVFVAARPRARDRAAQAWRRLREGMEMNNSLVSAKALLEMQDLGIGTAEIAGFAARFGLENRDSWGGGLTSLTALANVSAFLGPKTRYLANYQGVRRVAADCQGQTPRRKRYTLEEAEASGEQLQQWLLQWIQVRHRDAAERTLLTACESRMGLAAVNRMFFSAALVRPYADTGHVVDFGNKAFELVEMMGEERAGEALPSMMGLLANARGGEERNDWRLPIDLVELVGEAARKVPDESARGAGKTWSGEAELAALLLGDDPRANLTACLEALGAGATALQLSRAVTLAAAHRVARFGSANDIGDWFTALHTFSYCHAMYEALRRDGGDELLPGVLHGAVSVYLDRFLNIPAASWAKTYEDLPDDADGLLEALLSSFDGRDTKETAARAVERYLELGHPVERLVDRLAFAVLREDADFHLIQMLEAGVREYFAWAALPEARVFLVGMARYFAAHFPTQRAGYQTAMIAWRLHRGEVLIAD